MSGAYVEILAIFFKSMGLRRAVILLEIARLGHGLISRATGSLQTPGLWRLLIMLSARLRICCGLHEYMEYPTRSGQSDMSTFAGLSFFFQLTVARVLALVKGVGFPNNDYSFMFVPGETHIVYTLFSVCTYNPRRESKFSFAGIFI